MIVNLHTHSHLHSHPNTHLTHKHSRKTEQKLEHKNAFRVHGSPEKSVSRKPFTLQCVHVPRYEVERITHTNTHTHTLTNRK